MKTVDTKGMKCPQPLVMAKRALAETEEGSSFRLITDNEASKNNLMRYLADNGVMYDLTSNKGIHTFIIKRGEVAITGSVEEYCEITPVDEGQAGPGYVVVLNSETMGTGNDDLGMILMKSFLSSIAAGDELPSAILFYNSGVKLATKNSFIKNELEDLNKKGIKILLCETCVNFYNIKNEVSVGILSNMLVITEIMTGASKILYS